ncbi:Predicted oxidoreductase [Lacicoccus qingdaonensis]|uniref:Predicted oxidoreductase n=2 Tax=Lacicoccus qingdaonensis TaxID=576118 RepID=A0A1G9CP39_9BACL|nr:Predicted oxidoreductase [Salinicoccus qingdaonensis]
MINVQSNNNLILSQVALGCMNLPLEDEIKTEEIIEYALSENINYFDTADLYQFGRNEEVTGKILSRYRSRHDFTIGTKVGNEFDRHLQQKIGWNPTAKYIKGQVKNSLHRMNVDSIDLYQLHGGTIEDDKDETIEAFEDLKAEGIIKSYGLSSIRPNVIDYYIRNSNIDTLMLQFNPIDNRPLELMTSLEDVVVMARGPLMQGLFTQKSAEVLQHKFPDGMFNYSSDELNAILGELMEVSDDLTALSYRYILDSANIIVSGVSTLEQLENNMDSYRKSLEINSSDFSGILQKFKKLRYEEHRI